MDWIQVAQTLGVACVCLFALGIGVWKACRWTASNIIIPVRDQHFQFLKSVREANETQSDSLRKLVSSMEVIAESSARLGSIRDSELKRMEFIAQKLEQIVAGFEQGIQKLQVHAQTVVVGGTAKQKHNSS